MPVHVGGFIREQDPLKQGLKLLGLTYFLNSPVIREQDPLKQGLKLPSIRIFSTGPLHS